MSETKLVRACLNELRARGCLAIRINSGAMKGDHKGKRWFMRFNDTPGCSDIVGCTPSGRFLAVECKVGRNCPTDKQRAFLEAVSAAGGIALVVIDDTDRMWEVIVAADSKPKQEASNVI